MSTAKKAAEAKQKKQRILLGVLVAVFAAVLVFQAPTIMGLFGGGDSSTPPGDDRSTSASTGSTTTEGDEVTGTSGSAGSASSGGSAASGGTVPDSDIMAAADLDELATISRFTSSTDPFAPLIRETTTTSSGDPDSDEPTGDSADGSSGSSGSDDSGSSSSGDDDTSSSSGRDDGNTTTTQDPDTDPSVGIFGVGPGVTVELRINDLGESVEVGDAFPASNPVFRLHSVQAEEIHVGLVQGAFSTGSSTIAIERGETRTLVSQPDGTRYRIKYLGY